MTTPAEVRALADAMWQLLDDMGKEGESVRLFAKAQARIAYEPFLDKVFDDHDDWMSLAEAEAVILSQRRACGLA